LASIINNNKHLLSKYLNMSQNQSAPIPESKPQRILLGHLASFGDCLYATTLAKQIKADYPDSHLTWAIGSIYSSVLIGNPHVDKVWEIPLRNRDDVFPKWYEFQKIATEKYKNGDFDQIFLTQICHDPDNFRTYDGTLRSSILRFYGKPITVGVTPVIYLNQEEINNVYDFAQTNNLINNEKVVLFECSAKSEQSFVTEEFAIELAQKIAKNLPDWKILMSSNISIPQSIQYTNIIDASNLSFRENAELTKYCSLLIGCSSGISWLTTSSWAKKLPMVQLLKADKSMYASFIYDHRYHGLQVDHIIEITDTTVEHVFNCIISIVDEGFTTARSKFNQEIPLDFTFYFKTIASILYRKRMRQFFSSLRYTIQRYGLHPSLIKSFFPLIPYIANLAINKFIKSRKSKNE
jgi:ADP-heptose:LPS heptosyltransferase